MKLPSLIDIVWSAGFFDGEGSVILVPTKNTKRGRNYNLRITMGSTYLPALLRLKELWATGHISPYKATPRRKPMWVWNIHSNNACRILEHIFPYLHIKKSEAYFGIVFQHWKKRDSGLWGRSGRPMRSFILENQCKLLLPSCRSADLTEVGKKLEEILGTQQLQFRGEKEVTYAESRS